MSKKSALLMSSRISLSSTTEGIDVLGAKETPENFRDWSQLVAARIVSAVLFKRTVLLLILVCAALLGARTVDRVRNDAPDALAAINLALNVLLITFSLELIVSVVCYQDQVRSAGWLIADIIIVVLVWWTNDVSLLVLRSFRLLRALRKASGVPALKWAVKAVLRVLPRLAAVITVLIPGMFAIFAILFTNLYQDADLNGGDAVDNGDQQQLSEDYFGRLDVAALTLFQIMTGGRNWAVVCAELQAQYPSAWLPMVSFVVVSLFFFGSLIIAVMCDAVSNVNRDRMWKSLDPDHTAPTTDSTGANDPLLFGGGQYSAPQPQSHLNKPELHRLEQKLDELATTVDTLVRMQALLQESLNALAQREMARQLLLSHPQKSKGSSATSSPAQSETGNK
jgi:voltage-gated sodium channel